MHDKQWSLLLSLCGRVARKLGCAYDTNMIKDSDGNEIETFRALQGIVEMLDEHFPDDNSVFQRVSRLAEECGELASAVNHREGMGIKKEKYGEADDAHLVKEIRDVLRAAVGIARHYGLEDGLEQSIEAFYQSYQRQRPTSQR
jgi:NTP pyrophosphatase (non-canonical NTP hydrolase)